jgi:aconitate hydratase
MKPHAADPFSAHATTTVAGREVRVARLAALEEQGLTEIARLPYSIRVLLENQLRRAGGPFVSPDHVAALAGWGSEAEKRELPFFPARVLLQDFTGVPCVVDLAAMRSAVAKHRGDPRVINPIVPVDLVIDHSLQVDHFGSADSEHKNVKLEMRRNVERYSLLRWASEELANFRVVPPGVGIVHQVNLEYLAPVVHLERHDHGDCLFMDTCVGTDSHTTMINGIGVLGWGVGGIEAEAVMLGQPYFMLVPEVYGVRLTGKLGPGTTATDAVLAITAMLRRVGVVGRFVEFFGPGLDHLDLPSRATIANMAPEYGATCGYFPVDEETLAYLRLSGRDDSLVEQVAGYTRLQGLFRETGSADPEYTRTVELDLGDVHASMAGPRRPQDLVKLEEVKEDFSRALPALALAGGRADATICSADVCLIGAPDEVLGRLEAEGGQPGGAEGYRIGSGETQIPIDRQHWVTLRDGDVVIASITSCTNTSNPAVMIGAALLARNAVKKGLGVPPWVKTSMAPGSRVVTDYLEKTGLLPYLEALRFDVVGYGCATCIGNSGPLPEVLAAAITENSLVTASVLSGNRNFEGRIHPLIRANYLASPILVVAYALAGSVDVNMALEPLGRTPSGEPVYLRDIWPDEAEIGQLVGTAITAEMCRRRYEDVFEGEESWRRLAVPKGSLYSWQEDSTYVREPPFFAGMPEQPQAPEDILGARVLGLYGHSITTDHISPAGTILADSSAGRYLLEQGVPVSDFNTFGARRGNHEVMLRGTLASPRIRNALAGGREGGWTVHQPSQELMTVYDAGERYRDEGVPLVVIAGKEYGTGSSRDWAAKGPALMGVRAVIAESFERIHRSNLVGMGVLPLQFEPGMSAEALGLTGREIIDVEGLAEGLQPGGRLRVKVRHDGDGNGDFDFPVLVRLDSPIDLEYYRHGGILPRVLRLMLSGEVEQGEREV